MEIAQPELRCQRLRTVHGSPRSAGPRGQHRSRRCGVGRLGVHRDHDRSQIDRAEVRASMTRRRGPPRRSCASAVLASAPRTRQGLGERAILLPTRRGAASRLLTCPRSPKLPGTRALPASPSPASAHGAHGRRCDPVDRGPAHRRPVVDRRGRHPPRYAAGAGDVPWTVVAGPRPGSVTPLFGATSLRACRHRARSDPLAAVHGGPRADPLLDLL